MDTPKRKSKTKRPPKFKNNVSYFAEEFRDEKFSSPKNVLERYLDEYRSKECTAPKIMVITLEDDEALSMRVHNISPGELIILGSRLVNMGLGDYGTADDQ